MLLTRWPESVLNIQNPKTVECPEDGLVFDLLEADHQLQDEEDEGKAIMATLTGFNPTFSNPMMTPNPTVPDLRKARVVILEQPASHKLRFRYECEGRFAGSLQGAHSTNDNRTYPTIKVEGYQGPASVVVSCVEDKPPYRAHPHNLVGKGSICRKGVCNMDINSPDMTVQFQNLGIQCVRRKDAPESLAKREAIHVDPFKQGFAHKNGPINLNAVRLCFQVFLKVNSKLIPLTPVVSNMIYDRKAYSDLQITEVSDDTSPVQGGKKILLFCEKVDKNDIEVHFNFPTKGGWITRKGEFTPSDVHKQYGIAFRTPPYPERDLTERTRVEMVLFKPSDQSSSDAADFYYIPHTMDMKLKVEDGMERNPGLSKTGGSQKRGRESKLSTEDKSSGQINVPPKMSPSTYRDVGGQVTVVETVTPGSKAGSLKIEPDVLFGDKPFLEVVAEAAVFKAPTMMNDLNLPQQQPQGDVINTSEIAAVMADNSSLPNLNLNSDDLTLDISNNIEDLRLEGNSNSTRRSAGQQQPVLGRQSSQLQTPDISMEDFRSGSFKRNNLNK